ncbi:MAG: hypothetical protein U0835_27075 [Isosphaeraceae bacterium]
MGAGLLAEGEDGLPLHVSRARTLPIALGAERVIQQAGGHAGLRCRVLVTQPKWSQHVHFFQPRRALPPDEPDFFLGFTSSQRRDTFGPGGQVEVDWPAGAYRVNGWTFPELEGHEDGWLDQYLIELSPWA